MGPWALLWEMHGPIILPTLYICIYIYIYGPVRKLPAKTTDCLGICAEGVCASLGAPKNAPQCSIRPPVAPWPNKGICAAICAGQKKQPELTKISENQHKVTKYQQKSMKINQNGP